MSAITHGSVEYRAALTDEECIYFASLRIRELRPVIGFAILLAIAMPLAAVAQEPSLSAPPAAPSSTTATMTVLVTAGTAGPVHVVGTISSGSAKVNDVFQIQVAEDVSVNGMVVFRKGAGGQGHIIDSDSAGGNGHSGAISLAFDYVYAADGGRVQLSESPQKQSEEDRKGASSTATIIGFATFGLGGLFAHNLAHGRQRTIDDKTVLSSFVESNVHIATSERTVVEKYDKQ